MAKWQAWHDRREIGKLAGSGDPLTTDEIKRVVPRYVAPTDTQAESVGDEIMTFSEEILWARDHRAMVENGEEAPRHFPNKGALSWYQYAMVSREKFMQLVASVSKPVSDGEDVYMQDGQYQMKEIVRQIESAVQECGEQIVEYESAFIEMLKPSTN